MNAKRAFRVGMRVQMKAEHCRTHPHLGSTTGVVVSIGRATRIRIKRDRIVFADSWDAAKWEPAPLAFDDTAVLLAKAVLDGDTDAAMLLADRVFELCGATPR